MAGVLTKRSFVFRQRIKALGYEEEDLVLVVDEFDVLVVTESGERITP